jgi:hypothetical protein
LVRGNYVHPGTERYYSSPEAAYDHLTGLRDGKRVKTLIPAIGMKNYSFGELRENKSVYYAFFSNKTGLQVAEVEFKRV